MSIAGLLFALAPAITARVKKPKPVEQFALDHWRKAYGALEAENARLYSDLARLMDENARLQAENGVLRDKRRCEQHRAMQDFLQNAQNQQLSQLAFYQQGLQGSQNTNFERFCNCVPDRASFLLE